MNRRTLTLVGLGLIAVYIGYYLVLTVKRNYDLQQQISKLQQDISDLQIEKDQLAYKIQYYQTDSYKEKEARSRLGLQAQGEGVIILPHGDDSHTEEQTKQAKPHRNNFQQWADFLLGNG